MWNKLLGEVCKIIPIVGGEEVEARKGDKDTSSISFAEYSTKHQGLS